MALGGAGILLAMGFSNLAAISLAHAVTRRREMAMRLALGATGCRLGRQLLIESVVLALVGGTFGVLVACWLTGLLGRFFSDLAAVRLDLALDWRTVAFTGMSDCRDAICRLSVCINEARVSRLGIAAVLLTEFR